jgi:RNA polymerase sigma factor for flagellar operon FliA
MPEFSASPSSLVDRDQMIEQHRSYVRALAVEILHSLSKPVDLNELVAYGQVGLIEAAERYDPRRGVAFATFAHYRIKGSIYDGLREMGYLSRSQRTRQRFAAHANDLIQAAADDEQVHAEGAATVDDEIAAAQSLIDSLIPVYLLSLDSDKVPDLVDQHAMNMEKIEQRELVRFVMQCVSQLSEDEQELINAIYFKHISMTLLAQQMGITKSWISRLHARAVKHLRDALAERGILETE